ncbi:hypothetical protein BD311DRAFT_772084 [Dichomitus squalens]|uniref:Transcription activator of gluconeogenesis ERT1 n=1 Tax=Dichomitus squalens TaxID=114155 RepID=A0A4Q9M5B0_9APHY|nr:hypothetical protein BD311DRAFT_772084 [Dichomitus squalens]
MASHSYPSLIDVLPSPETFVDPEYVLVVLHKDQYQPIAGNIVQLPENKSLVTTGRPSVSTTIPYYVATLGPQHVCFFLHRSQLHPVGGVSINGLQSSTQGDPSLKVKKPSRKSVKISCINCRKAAKRCDPGRPCRRCQKMGLGDSCVDAPSRRGNTSVKRSGTMTIPDSTHMPLQNAIETHEVVRQVTPSPANAIAISSSTAYVNVGYHTTYQQGRIEGATSQAEGLSIAAQRMLPAASAVVGNLNIHPADSIGVCMSSSRQAPSDVMFPDNGYPTGGSASTPQPFGFGSPEDYIAGPPFYWGYDGWRG